MRHVRASAVACLILLANLVAAGCDNGGLASRLPTVPTPLVGTENLSGTITQGDSTVHPFSTHGEGTVSVALTRVSPESIGIGLSIGLWNGVSCNLRVQVADARQGNSYETAVTGAGNYCLTVYDPGTIEEGALVSYVLSITHP
jgi:hypothetical protein